MIKTIKMLTLTAFVFMAASSLFAQEYSSDLLQAKLEKISENYGVKKIELPLDYSNFPADDFKYFATTTPRSKEPVTSKITYSVKRKTQWIHFFDVTQSYSYGWNLKIKVIDFENQVVQILKIKNTDCNQFLIYDVNFDGCDDLVLLARDERGEPKKYDVLYWNNTAKQFSKTPDRILEPLINQKDKVIVQKYEYSDSTVYAFYRYILGKRRLIAKYKIVLPANENTDGPTIYFLENNDADFENTEGTYIYTLPGLDEFNAMDEKAKKSAVKQYNEMAKMINDLL